MAATLKIWLLQQDEANELDTYDSVIVAAATAEDAQTIHPRGPCDTAVWRYQYSWASDPRNVTAKLLGTAAPGIERGVLLASFNAG